MEPAYGYDFERRREHGIGTQEGARRMVIRLRTREGARRSVITPRPSMTANADVGLADCEPGGSTA